MATKIMVEKFSPAELSNLRSDLLQSGFDSWQAAEVVSVFLAGRGYGASAFEVRNAVTEMDVFASTESIQTVLEKVAYVM